MRIQIFDIGNSNLKMALWEVSGNKTKLLQRHSTPTAKNMKENLEVVEVEFDQHESDAAMVISMSDNVVYTNHQGYIRWIPAGEPAHPYITQDKIPPYNETGKPQGETLSGILNQLAMVKTQIGARDFGAPIRILPFSAMVAAWLVGDKYFNCWDITHASNSGVFSYQIPNKADERFPLNGWHPCIDDIIEKGWINKEILKSNHVVGKRNGCPILLGGHDTTFAVANHNIYSTKPYISCGTWLTVSVESSVTKYWKDEGARYIVAPNGAILKQLCFESPRTEEGKIHASKRINNYLKQNLVGYESRVPIFGSWGITFLSILSELGEFEFEFEFELQPHEHLTEQAAIYVSKVI